MASYTFRNIYIFYAFKKTTKKPLIFCIIALTLLVKWPDTSRVKKNSILKWRLRKKLFRITNAWMQVFRLEMIASNKWRGRDITSNRKQTSNEI